MEIQTIYSIVRQREQYSPRQYIDTRSKSTSILKVKHKRRMTIIEEEAKSAKKIPGPGKYNVSIKPKQYKKKPPTKIDFEKQSKKPSERYLDKMVKTKLFMPGVGKYNPEVDNTEKIKMKYKAVGDRIRKEAPLFKQTCFDDNQIDMINVGPGAYSPYEAFGQKKSFRISVQFGKNEEDLTSKDKDKDNKVQKSQSLIKLPSVHSYNPIHQDYDTFDGMASKSGTSQFATHTFTTSQRKLSIKEGPGPKYSLIAQWSPRNNTPSKNIFKSVSTLRHAGVYH